MKKGEGPEVLKLVRTPDVLAEASRKVAGARERPLLVGFAAETERVLEHAREKLERKGLDAIVANDVTAPGRGLRDGHQPGDRADALGRTSWTAPSARSPRGSWSCSELAAGCRTGA